MVSHFAVLCSALVWAQAGAYLRLDFNASDSYCSNLRRTASRRGALAPLSFPPALRRLLSCADGRVDASSSPPLGTSLSRGQFIGGLLASSAGLVLCTGAAGAAGTEHLSNRATAAASDEEGNASAGQIAAVEREPQKADAVGPESAASSAISGLVAGAAVSTSKQLLLHPVDTIKTRLQLRRDGSSPELFSGLYDGVVPPLLAGLPSGALFFSAKDSFSTAIGNVLGGQYADLTTVAAVGLAQFPYWGIRTPAELLKTRSQAGLSTGSRAGLQGVKSIMAEEGVKGLYTGYISNIVYAFPADAIKFLVYGALKRSAKESNGGAKLGPIEAAVLGSGASLVAQAATTPLDVVRTRVMTASPNGEGYEGGVVGALGTIAQEEGFSALWAGTTPRVARSVLSGAIQFGAYEFVKGLFGVEPRKL